MGEAELGRDLSPIIYFPNDTIICLIFIIQYRRYKQGIEVFNIQIIKDSKANVL